MSPGTLSLAHVLGLAAVLFTVGAIGVVVRRNALTVLMSIELMLNAANLTFVAFARFPVSGTVSTVQQAMTGHAAAFFVIAVAAAEAAVGLALVIAVFRKRETSQVDDLTLLKDPEPLPAEPGPAAPAVAAASAH
jgi:NADH-quinone oxidoreductase subunit K